MPKQTNRFHKFELLGFGTAVFNVILFLLAFILASGTKTNLTGGEYILFGFVTVMLCFVFFCLPLLAPILCSLFTIVVIALWICNTFTLFDPAFHPVFFILSFGFNAILCGITSINIDPSLEGL